MSGHTAMRERAARALATAENPLFQGQGWERDDCDRELFRIRSRAVLDAVGADDMLNALNAIGQYVGEGPPSTPWQDIVRQCGETARAAIRKATGAP